MKKYSVLILMLLVMPAFAGLQPVDLRCDYAVNPFGVDSAVPRLFWKLESADQGKRQSAFEVLVASTEGGLSHNQGDLWESGKIASDETIQVPYGGRPFSSSQQVFWKVRVWDEHGVVTDWSKPARWTEGVLQDSDWRAKWIGSARTNIVSLMLRHEWSVKPGLKRAVIHICGLGQYELTLNGSKVGADFLSPGWTRYDKTCLYDTYEITGALKPGPNAVGIELGNGMYHVPGAGRYTKFKGSFGPQKAIAMIRMEYDDGSVEFAGTDDSWKCDAGPVTFTTIFGGEDYDARRLQHGWNSPGFDDSKWSPAVVMDGPGGKLRGLSCAAPPIQKFEVHAPVNSWTLTNGDVVYDLGQNASHVPQITVTGPAGSRVRLFPSELTNRDGSVNQDSMGGGRRNEINCEYAKAADGVESWEPKFFYVGCRYLQAHFTPADPAGPPPAIREISGVVVQSATDAVGEFECSNDMFNRVRKLVRWAQRSNMVSLMTDCPHRERLGWLEEDHLNGPALRYEFEMSRLFTKTLNDIADSQLTNGLVPTTAPEYTAFRDGGDRAHLRGMFGDSPEWSSTCILVPWQQYEFDGDLDLFRAHYDGMKSYLDYFGSRADNYIVNYGLGDWYDIGPGPPGRSKLTPIALTATAFYYQDVAIMARVAALLGRNDDAGRFSGLAEKIRAAFNEKFYNPTNHGYATGSQCANSIPLVMNICESSNRADVLDAIVRDVRSRGNSITAGDVGYRYLLRALAEGGRSDVIFDMNNQPDKPGYAMQLNKGKTSLTEAWDGGSSQNHFMLGQIQEWFYHDLAGIRSAENGFKKIEIAPQPAGDVTWARSSFESIRGKIASDWRKEGNTFNLKVSIPPNTTATVHVPAKSAESVNQTGATFLRMEDNCAVFGIGSGSYEFTAHE